MKGIYDMPEPRGESPLMRAVQAHLADKRVREASDILFGMAYDERPALNQRIELPKRAVVDMPIGDIDAVSDDNLPPDTYRITSGPHAGDTIIIRNVPVLTQPKFELTRADVPDDVWDEAERRLREYFDGAKQHYGFPIYAPSAVEVVSFGEPLRERIPVPEPPPIPENQTIDISRHTSPRRNARRKHKRGQKRR